MGRPSIKYVFEEKMAHVSTQGFWLELASNPEKYAKCKIASFTRVKDLNSNWKHEYVQYIVEEDDTKERARLYTERCNPKDLDQVQFGPRETADSKFKAPIPNKPGKFHIDLPLPLFSLMFDDPKKRPSLLDLADIFLITTMVGGPYVLTGHSCFWFADQVFGIMQMQYEELGQLKKWQYFNVAGRGGGGVKDFFSLTWTSMMKFHYVPDAKEFKKGREGTNMIYNDDKRPFLDDKQVANAIEESFSSGNFMQDYLKDMDNQLIDFDAEEVETALTEFKDNAATDGKQIDPSKSYSGEFDNEAGLFVYRVFLAPDARDMIRLWEEKAGAPAYDKDAPQKIQDVQLAIASVNGRILTLLKKLKEDQSFRQQMIEQLKKDPKPPTDTVKSLSTSSIGENDPLFGAFADRESFMVRSTDDPLFEVLSNHPLVQSSNNTQDPLFEALVK